jgi:hypothetical protein
MKAKGRSANCLCRLAANGALRIRPGEPAPAGLSIILRHVAAGPPMLETAHINHGAVAPGRVLTPLARSADRVVRACPRG